MILTHWPSNETWQLLEEPLTLEMFQPLIPMAPSKMGLGIEPETWIEVVEVLDDPVVCIKLRCKDGMKILATLVTSEEASSHNVAKQSNLERSVYTIKKKIGCLLGLHFHTKGNLSSTYMLVSPILAKLSFSSLLLDSMQERGSE